MASAKQKIAAKKNIKKAQAKWKSMTHRQHALAQPEGGARKKPGTTGKGDFYRIVVRPKEQFITFRNHDVGTKGHIERVTGRRKTGSWATHTWLIAKGDVEVKNGIIVGKTKDVRDILSKLQSKPKLIKGDIFEAKPRRNVPEGEKPTPAMKRAQTKNIKKAQAARWKK